METLFQKIVREESSIVTPLCTLLCDPFLEVWLNLGKINEDVFGAPNFWCGSTQFALWIDQLNGVDQVTASVTLVALSIWVAAYCSGALTCHEPVSQEF
jgi:hypothetical protein